MNNSVLECIKNRRSIRSYTDKKLTDEQVEALVCSALISPSSMNKQPWNISVMQNTDQILEFERDIVEFFAKNGPQAATDRIASRNNKIFYNAPLVFVISVESVEGLIDVGILAQSVSLAATSMGLGSVILGLPRVAFMGEKSEQWKSDLKIPQGYIYGTCVAVGYTTEKGIDREIDRSKVTYL